MHRRTSTQDIQCGQSAKAQIKLRLLMEQSLLFNFAARNVPLVAHSDTYIPPLYLFLSPVAHQLLFLLKCKYQIYLRTGVCGVECSECRIMAQTKDV